MHDPVHEVRDPLYGFVKLSRAEWKIIDCPTFQRLRDIRQLAMGHMVYPGATHTRFEHSVGCAHLSSQVLDYLQEHQGATLDKEYRIPKHTYFRARQVLRLAALLHDIGHPPFSHSGEHLLPPKMDESGQPVLKEGKPQKLSHEDMTARIIRETEIGDRIEEYFQGEQIGREEVIAVATAPKRAQGFRAAAHHLLLNEILTGDLGTDRVDYLLRDAFHSGQESGQFDHRRLISTMEFVPRPESEGEGYQLGFNEGGWLVAEQMIVARYLMYLSLYFHKTKRIYEKHLEDFMREWLAATSPNGCLPHEPLKYAAMTDSIVFAELEKAAVDPKAPGHQHARRFHGRNHMRLAKEIILADNYVEVSGRRKPRHDRFDKLKDHVRITFGDAVLCDEPDHSATKMFDAAHKILVLLDGKPRYLDDISEIVRGMSSKIWRGRIYADADKLTEVKKACDDWLDQNK